MKRKLLVASAAAVLLLLLYRKARTVMIDPLINSGLSNEEIRRYRYLLALGKAGLEEVSAADIFPSLQVDAIRSFLAQVSTRVCNVCGHWYLDSVLYCPHDHTTTLPVSEEKLSSQINAWEDFRKRYVETTRIRGLTRHQAIKLHYYLDHIGSR